MLLGKLTNKNSSLVGNSIEAVSLDHEDIVFREILFCPASLLMRNRWFVYETSKNYVYAL
jgi:hypothetical protein